MGDGSVIDIIMITIVMLLLLYLFIMLASGINTILFRLVNNRKIGKLDKCFCDYCELEIPFDLANFPIYNWLVTKGITRCCKKPINRYHLYSEIVIGSAIFIIFLGVTNGL